MFFTDADSRHEQQLMAELNAAVGAPEQLPLTILPVYRSHEEQRRLKQRWDRRHPRTYQIPGERSHE